MNLYFLFFVMHGRIPRRMFWLGVGLIFLLQLAIQAPLIQMGHFDPDREVPPLWFRDVSLLMDAVSAWPLFAVLSKRQQDRNQGPTLSFVFLSLLLLFSICEAFALTQVGEAYTTLGWIVGLPLLGVFVVILAELGGRSGTPGPNAFGPEPQ